MQNKIDKLKELIENTRNYFVEYFDDIRNKISDEYTKKLHQQLDEETKKELQNKWSKLNNLVETCQQKCSINRLNEKVFKETRAKIAELESNQVKNLNESLSSHFESDLDIEVFKLKNKLENYLVSNDSCLVFSIRTNECFKVVLVEQGLSSNEISFLKSR